MDRNIAAIVLGVKPVNGELLPQTRACLDAARDAYEAGTVDQIIVIGGYGHGAGEDQPAPESEMMGAYLADGDVPIIQNGVPVTTPEVLWELRGLAARLGLTTGSIVYAIHQRAPRIDLLSDMIAPELALTVEMIDYELQPLELETVQYESYLLEETERELRGMRPGDDVEFCRRWSFHRHLWWNFVRQCWAEGNPLPV